MKDLARANEYLHKNGYRFTPQRKVIIDVLANANRHLTPEEVFEQVKGIDPGINLVTVYRNLNFLCEIHLAVATQIGHKFYYEIAGAQPHHHLVCQKCGGMQSLPHDRVEKFYREIEAEDHFQIQMDHLTLFGYCIGCSGEPEHLTQLTRENDEKEPD